MVIRFSSKFLGFLPEMCFSQGWTENARTKIFRLNKIKKMKI